MFTVEKGGPRVNMTGGPLAYKYQFEELYVHYGPEDVVGSEHLIQGISFPAEVSSQEKWSWGTLKMTMKWKWEEGNLSWK